MVCAKPLEGYFNLLSKMSGAPLMPLMPSVPGELLKDEAKLLLQPDMTPSCLSSFACVKVANLSIRVIDGRLELATGATSLDMLKGREL